MIKLDKFLVRTLVVLCGIVTVLCAIAFWTGVLVPYEETFLEYTFYWLCIAVMHLAIVGMLFNLACYSVKVANWILESLDKWATKEIEKAQRELKDLLQEEQILEIEKHAKELENE